MLLALLLIASAQYPRFGQGQSHDGGVAWPVEVVSGTITGTVQVGSVSIDGGSVSVSNFPAVQSVTLDGGTAFVAQSGTWSMLQSGTWTVGLSAGSQVIGHVIVDTAPTTAVTGTFFQGTQPVSIASMPSTPVTGTFWQATQPVSGSVSVSNFPTTQPVSLASVLSVTLDGGQAHVLDDPGSIVNVDNLIDGGSLSVQVLDADGMPVETQVRRLLEEMLELQKQQVLLLQQLKGPTGGTL